MIYNILESSILNIWPSLIIMVVTLVTIRVFYLKTNKINFILYKELYTLLAIIYLLLLYQLVTRVDVNNLGGFNIIPFTEIFRYDLDSELFWCNVIGNILLFVPFGYIFSSYVKPKSIFSSLFVALIVSATIEVVQLNIGRSFDIDDIILNTIGCVIGFLIYVGFRAIANHLPSFLKSKWFNNLICIIIFVMIIIYFLKVIGWVSL